MFLASWQNLGALVSSDASKGRYEHVEHASIAGLGDRAQFVLRCSGCFICSVPTDIYAVILFWRCAIKKRKAIQRTTVKIFLCTFFPCLGHYRIVRRVIYMYRCEYRRYGKKKAYKIICRWLLFAVNLVQDMIGEAWHSRYRHFREPHRRVLFLRSADHIVLTILFYSHLYLVLQEKKRLPVPISLRTLFLIFLRTCESSHVGF